jgi:xeroderma pigmentosum group C-complementing protein
MPPFIPKKRLASTPPPPPRAVPAKKQRLADVLDAEARNIPGLSKQASFNLRSDDSESSLSDVDSDQFEDVSAAVKQSTTARPLSEDDDEDEDDEFEDVEMNHQDQTETENQPRPGLAPGETLRLKFDAPDGIDYSTFTTEGKKKGPTRQQKEIRARTHQLHVRFLLWHNAIRNAWICDKEVQSILLAQLPSQIKKEVEKWKRASGIAEQPGNSTSSIKKAKKGKKDKAVNPRDERDWGRPSQRLEAGKADLSRGDPLIPLLKVLAAYWKKRFAITAPGLRKRGYGPKIQLKKDVESFRKDDHDPERHGERIRNIKDFREIAKKSEGSRDVGAQLFTSLLRGLGIESRLVASLQPAGWGFTKVEEMVPRKASGKATMQADSDSEASSDDPIPVPKARNSKTASSAKKKKTGQKAKGNQQSPIDLDSDASAASASDDDSIIDITPSMPKQRAPKYDRDLLFPIYWTEAISPVTNQVIPVDPLVLEKPVASTPELLMGFEPRGAKAENARLVIAYVVAHSDDGTAKDVTVRYLRKHIWPGKTKPFRYPVEKLPVYDRSGRVKRYEDSDWFKYIMSGYVRTDRMRTVIDDIEDSTDLVSQLPEKKAVDTSVDTLQSLKASPDFVLERFLRREEALRPGAKPDRMFVSGKGDTLKSEPVYRRADVERCLTAESWHKEGRHPKPDEEPLKMVPVRAVTLTRKREAEEHERITGEKQMQGLYSWDQTDYIIPPPIKDGVIPKNSYGNIDCFVPSMVPKGAVHIPLRSTVRICKKLEIDYAEAVVGFEFGNKRAVPVINGVVIAKENEHAVRTAWREWNEEQQRKDAVKQEKLVLDLWRKFIVGMRIRERVGEMYGADLDAGEANARQSGNHRDDPIDVDDDEDARPGPSTTSNVPPEDESMMGGGFLVSDDEEEVIHDELVIEHHAVPAENAAAVSHKGKERATEPSNAAAQYPTPVSMSSAKKPVARRQQRAKPVVDEMEDEGEDGSLSSGLSEVEDGSEDRTIGAADRPTKMTESSSEASAQTSSAELDEEGDYQPQPSPRRRGRPPNPQKNVQNTSQQKKLPTRSTRPRQSIIDDSDTVDSEEADTDEEKGPRRNSTKTPKSRKQTPTSRKQTPGSNRTKAAEKAVLSTPKSLSATGTTSPYFKESPLKQKNSTGTSKRRGKRKPGF